MNIVLSAIGIIAFVVFPDVSSQANGRYNETTMTTAPVVPAAAALGAEDRIMEAIFADYSAASLPHVGPTNVSLHFHIQQILKLDLFKGTIHIGVWPQMSWEDPRLVWDPAQFDNVTTIRVDRSAIWIPDIGLYGSADAPKETVSDVRATVSRDGMVVVIPPLVVKAACEVNVADYPYDTHECSLKWGSWATDSSRISLNTPEENSTHLEFYHENPEWKLVETEAVKSTTSYACCPASYDDVTLRLKIRRASSHGFISPSVIASWLILVAFIIGPRSGAERVLLGALLFIALVVMTASLNSSVPMYSTTRLGRYQLAGMLLTAIVTAVNALLHRVHPENMDKEDAEGASKFFLIIDVAGMVITVILLAIITGALFTA